MSEHVWYFLKESFAGESQEGPLTEPQFVQLVKKGHLKKSTKICSPTRTKGQWTTVEKVPSIAALIDQGKQERAQEKAARAAAKQQAKSTAQHVTEAPSANELQQAAGIASPSAELPTPMASPVSIPTPPEPPLVNHSAAANESVSNVSFNAASLNAAAVTKIETAPEGFRPKTYTGMNIVRIICYVLAIIAVISLLITSIIGIVGLFGLLGSEFDDLFWAALLSVLSNIFFHVLTIVVLIFFANLISVLLDIQSNTQLSAFLASRGNSQN